MTLPDSITKLLSALLVSIGLCSGTGWMSVAQAEEAATAAADTAMSTEDTAATAVADTAAEPPAAEPATEEAAGDKTPARRNYGYRAEQNRRLARIKEAARIRRENMERWRSQRRWWNNPEAEDRRQWNKARSQWYRDMAEARQRQYEQYRPVGREYRFRYERVYP